MTRHQKTWRSATTAAGAMLLAVSLSACGGKAGITADTTCEEFLSDFTSQERADAVARLAVELDVPSAANPMVALTVDYDCGYKTSTTLGDLIRSYG